MKNNKKIFYRGKANDYFKITIITLTLLLVIFMNVSLMFSMMSRQTEEIGQIQLDRIKGDLEGAVAEAERIVMRVAIGSEQLVADEGHRDDLAEYIIGQKNSQKDISNGNCTNIYIAGKDWQIIPDFDVPSDFHAPERVWYKGAADNFGEVFITEPYIDIVSGDMCFTVSTMLSDHETVVGADFNFSHLQEMVSRMTEGTDRTALITTKQGMIVGYTDMSYVGQYVKQKLPEYTDVFERVVNSKEHPGFRMEINGVKQTIFSSETSNQWYMILCVDNVALYRDNFRQMIINTFVSLVMVVVIIFFYTVSVHNRIKSEKALAVKEEFLSSLSVELREPLKRVLNRCDMMLSSRSGGHDDVAEIKESGLRLSEMLDNLFSFSSMVSDDESKNADKARGHVQLPKVSRFIRNGVILALTLTLVTVQLIIIRTTVSWGDSKMENETGSYENRVSQWVTQQESVLSMFTNMISVNPAIMDDYEGAVKWLDGIVKNYPEISVCYMTNPYKEHTVIMNNGWQPDENWKVEERPWYAATERSPNKFNISAPYLDEQTGSYCITMSKMVYGKNGEFLGIFGIDFFMDKLINILGESYTKSGYAFLVDGEGIIINHPNPDYQMSAGKSTSIEDTVYNNVYHSDKSLVIRDYTGEYVTCKAQVNEPSGFTVIVVNRWWDIYANTVVFPLLLLVLFGICIAAVIMLINRLISWQQEVNRKLSRSADMALAAGRAQAQFMAQMSHEIRTPINAVLGMNEMILSESSDKEILEYSENIRRAGKTLLDLINSILDYSKIESGKMEIIQSRYETAGLIDDLVNMITERAEKKGLEFKTDIDPSLPKTLYGDEMRIKQIITNMLTNAVKYTHEGSVTLHISGESSDGEDCRLFVKVSDTGIGIRREDMDSLFTSFKRLDEEKNRNIEGTGLGISIVQRLLDMMDSKLKVESEYGRGSEFYFYLKQKIVDKTPIGEYDPKHTFVSESASDTPVFAAVGADVMVVDDNDMNLKVAKGLMKRCGVVPDLVQSGLECIELVGKKHYDIIFLDHMMPGTDGVETFRILKERNILPDDTAVIVLTANAIAGARESYIKEGFDDYLSKPIEVRELEKMLKKHLPDEKIKSAEKAQPKDEAKTAGTPLEMLESAGINTSAGIEYSAGSEEFYFEMLGAFVEDADKKAADIKADFDANNLKDYRTRVHALKGTAKMIGADKLSALALEQENAAKEGRAEDVAAGYPVLAELYGKTVSDIRAVLEIYGGEK